MADPTNIHRIIVNLCTNSLHAMANEKGTLSISLCRKEILAEDIKESDVSPGSFIVLSISDTGQGMDQKTRQRIFDPYFTTKEVGKGTGLGLSVIHGIVKDYKGFVDVESEPEKGTSFHICLPALEKNISIPEEEEIDETLLTGNERILVVDDESDIVNIQKSVLERLGYKVTGTTDSLYALEQVRINPGQFDLIITDQAMPNLSGANLAEEVLQIKQDMPIILCTGYSSIISEEVALAMGIKKYVLKPVGRKTLAKIARMVLDEN